MALPRWFMPGSLVLVLLFGCTGSSPRSSGPTATATRPSPTTTGASALVRSLPGGCTEQVPARTATVTFVASGRAWAVAPDGTGLVCLFEVDDPGSFAWGPRADRVAVGGLAVRGVGSDASRSEAGVDPQYLSWGRPAGKAIAFADGPKLQKAIVGSENIEDITPLDDVTYRDVAYHPSGLAIAFVVDGPKGSAIWLSSNTGETPKRLVWSRSGTVFGPLAFDLGGDLLYYAAHASDGRVFIAYLVLSRGLVREGMWKGHRDVLRVLPSPPLGGDSDPRRLGRLALNVGTGCTDSRALLTRLERDQGTDAFPRAEAPTEALGWPDPSTVLLAVGGCGPVDLWTISAIDGAPTLLVRGVDRGSVRVADPTPPPPLPQLGVKSEFA